MSDVVLAVDAGGTKLLSGLVRRDGSVLFMRQVPTPRVDDRCDPEFAEVTRLLEAQLDEAKRAQHRVRGIGIGVPEFVRGNLLTSDAVFAWSRQLADLVSESHPGLAIVIESDVRVAAHAEAGLHWPSTPTLLYVSWGTGISSTLVVNGRCLEGRRGEALALGEFGVNPDVAPAWRSNLESFASGLGIGLRFSDLVGEPTDAVEVARLARDGHAQAADVLRDAARAVAYALRDCVNLLDPDVVVLGGGIGSGSPTLVDEVEKALNSLLVRPDVPPVVQSRLGAQAGLIGAGLRCWDLEPGP